MTIMLRLEQIITMDDVIEAHDEVIKNSLGINGLSGDKSLESALYRIDNQIHYHNLEDHFEIAAWYGYAIARGHTFVDGNKRTAYIIMLSYLDSCGFKINFKESDEEIAEYMEMLADGKIEVTQLTEWLKSNTTL